MYTYINKGFSNIYFETETFLNVNIGTEWEDYLNGKTLLLSEQQVAYHDIYPEAKVKDVWFMTPPHERTLEEAKKEMLDKIKKYDKSNYVCGFFLNNELMWLNMNQRANAMLTLNSARSLGLKSVPYLGIDFPIEEGCHAIDLLNIYAAQITAVTEKHKENVNKLERIIDVDAYDYTEGYPEQLHFEF